MSINWYMHFTLKQGCTAGIKLSLSGDHQCLKVTEVSEEHNHETSKVSLYSLD